MKKLFFAAIAVAALLGTGPVIEARADMSASEVEEALTCQCGCGLTVQSCNHLECSFAVPARKDIAESLARGETGEEIIQRYKLKYGEKVLSSPLPEGFNLLAWIAPYASILLAGTLMLLLFVRHARSRAAAGAGTEVPPPANPESPELEQRRAQLQREVEDLER